MLMGCATFTLMYTLVHELRQVCDWQVIALVRTGLACLFALTLAKLAGAKLVLIRPPVLWIRSIAGSISLLCSFFAMTRNVPLSNVLAINNVFPLWVALLAWPTLGTRPSWALLASVVVAVAGVFLIRVHSLGEIGALFDFGDDGTLAAVFALVASLATAVAMLGLNRLHWIDTRAVVAHFSGVSMLFCLAALWGFDRHRPALEGLTNLRTVAVLLGVGLAATIGQICLTKAFTIGAPAKVALVSLTQLVMTMLVDVYMFDESFTPLNLLGITMVMAPTAWIMGTRSQEPGIGEQESAVSGKAQAVRREASRVGDPSLAASDHFPPDSRGQEQ
jgi:drug/metabolite transporter (DMT)-like permease